MKYKFHSKFWIFLVVVIFLIFFCYDQNHHLTVTQYHYQNQKVAKEFDEFRIVQISDLHNQYFGKDGSQLLKKTADLNPGIIVLTGDLVDGNHTNIDRALTVVEGLTKICPVFYVTGNHEYWLSDTDRERLFQGLNDLNVIDLNDDEFLLQMDVAKLKLCGLDDNSLSKHTLHTDEKKEEEILTVLLAHEPQYLDRYAERNADLVLSGHAHGGQFILPFLGPVVAPDQGFFPQMTFGMHTMNQTTMYISRGLGNSIVPLRLFNYPEIVCVILECE